MRMRARKNLEARLLACGGLCLSEAFLQQKGPFHLEIGCGKGAFICETAAKAPNVFFVAAERYSNVMVLAQEKVMARNLSNVAFFRGDVKDLSPILEQTQTKFSRIYLNFSDPWPKKGDAKRRLTHEGFLKLYQSWLAPGGEIHMKTDNQKLFEFSLNSLSDFGFRLKNITFNLHQSDFSGNVETEFETRYASQGLPIYRLEAYLPEG